MAGRATARRGAAYVVLSHRDSGQIARLAAAIRTSSPNASVFVSHDGRGSEPPVSADPRVHVRTHGRETDWGSFAVIQAILDAFAWAREVADPDMIVLVSGQHYPCRPLQQWETDFLRAGGGWMGWPVPLRYTPKWRGNADGGDENAHLMRYSYRWFRVPRVAREEGKAAGVFRRIFSRTEKLVAARLLPRSQGMRIGVRRWPSPFIDDRPCYKGEAWYTVDRRLLDLLLARAVPGDRWFELFRHSLVPDEAYVQTLLSWEQSAQRDQSTTYTDWSEGGAHPKVLDITDLDAIRESGAGFCRKVEPERSAALLEALDEISRHPAV